MCASAAATRCIFHFITSLVCDDGDKTSMTEMSEGGGGEKLNKKIMYFN